MTAMPTMFPTVFPPPTSVSKWLHDARKKVARLISPEEPSTLLSQYRNSGQISINISKTISPSDFGEDGFCVKFSKPAAENTPSVRTQRFTSGPSMTEAIREALADNYSIESITPTKSHSVSVSGKSTVYTPFKPNRVVLSETITSVYSGKGLPDVVIATNDQHASDLLLVGLFSGSLNTFPNAPDDATGVHGPAFAANAFGVGISWPTVNAGIPVTAAFSILKSVINKTAVTRCATCDKDHPLAPGYGIVPTSVTVNIFLSLFGPQIK